MRFIHDKEITHGDLKSPAVLLTSSLTAKIGTFGGPRSLDSSGSFTRVVNCSWTAPEVRYTHTTIIMHK